MATVNEKMTAIADAIRAKTGGTEPLGLDAMAEAIAALETGGGLPDDIEEITYGTYEVASTSAGSSTLYVQHGMSSKPHLFAFIMDIDFGASVPQIMQTQTNIIGVTPGTYIMNPNNSPVSIGIANRFLSSGSTTNQAVNPATATSAYLGTYAVAGTKYRWIAVRFKL